MLDSPAYGSGGGLAAKDRKASVAATGEGRGRGLHGERSPGGQSE